MSTEIEVIEEERPNEFNITQVTCTPGLVRPGGTTQVIIEFDQCENIGIFRGNATLYFEFYKQNSNHRNGYDAGIVFGITEIEEFRSELPRSGVGTIDTFITIPDDIPDGYYLLNIFITDIDIFGREHIVYQCFAWNVLVVGMGIAAPSVTNITADPSTVYLPPGGYATAQIKPEGEIDPEDENIYYVNTFIRKLGDTDITHRANQLVRIDRRDGTWNATTNFEISEPGWYEAKAYLYVREQLTPGEIDSGEVPDHIPPVAFQGWTTVLYAEEREEPTEMISVTNISARTRRISQGEVLDCSVGINIRLPRGSPYRYYLAITLQHTDTGRLVGPYLYLISGTMPGWDETNITRDIEIEIPRTASTGSYGIQACFYDIGDIVDGEIEPGAEPISCFPGPERFSPSFVSVIRSEDGDGEEEEEEEIMEIIEKYGIPLLIFIIILFTFSKLSER